MNRRSAIKTAIGACVAMLLPWRAAIGARKPKEDQVERIKRLLHGHGVERRGGVCHRVESVACGRPSWRPLAQQRDSRTIEIYWDEQRPDDSGLYGVGLVLVQADVAASMDDDKLSDRLFHSFLLATTSKYADRQGMLAHGFKGKPVWIGRDKVIGAEFNRTDADSLRAVDSRKKSPQAIGFYT